jgi:two-component system response regulator AtoC
MLGDEPEIVKAEFLDNMKVDSLDVVEQQTAVEGELDTLRSLKNVKAEATRYIERKAITHALNRTGWNKREAAKMLKISYKALFYKMNDYGIKK